MFLSTDLYIGVRRLRHQYSHTNFRRYVFKKTSHAKAISFCNLINLGVTPGREPGRSRNRTGAEMEKKRREKQGKWRNGKESMVKRKGK